MPRRFVSRWVRRDCGKRRESHRTLSRVSFTGTSSHYSASKMQEIGKNRNLVMRKALGYTVSEKPWRKKFYDSLWNHRGWCVVTVHYRKVKETEDGEKIALRYLTLSLDILPESISGQFIVIVFFNLELARKINSHEKIYFTFSKYFADKWFPIYLYRDLILSYILHTKRKV